MSTKTQTKNCQNCHQDFTIAPEDFSFYEKIQVPPPTWCFECRLVRKMVWRNERIWYRRKCDATGKNVLSIFDPKGPYKVYEQEYWKSDNWDPVDYGREYNFSKNFFEQFSTLLKDIPHPNLVQKNVINSEYSNNSLDLKNCYMAISTAIAEDCAYISGLIRRLKESLDMYHCSDDEYCYEDVNCEKCNRLFFSEDCVSCLDSFFLYDCRNCTNCIGCVSLRNAQYQIFNKQYSREEYVKELEKLNTGSYNSILTIKSKFNELKLSIPRKYGFILNSQNVTGDDIIDSRNCLYCFNVKDRIEDCKYSFRLSQNTKDGYDGYIVWENAELFYESMSSSGRNLRFSGFIWGGFDTEYSYNCSDCNNIFGCTGLRNKSYCILNKQYSKEEYERTTAEIREHMSKIPYVDSAGRVYKYGEFFPIDLSPFAYNETPAGEYFPIGKEKAFSCKFPWKKPEEKNYQISKKVSELSDDIKDIEDSILSEVIECAHKGECNDQCATAFRIIPMELSFLRRFNISLPRLCFACRHMQRIHSKNPLRLWHRQCMCNKSNHFHGASNCQIEFETSYAPERPEIIYCEKCYQQEVY